MTKERDKAYWAEEDTGEHPSRVRSVDDLTPEILKILGKPNTSYFDTVREKKDEQLNQDEFHKDKDSPRCTIYANFAHYTHYHGRNIEPKGRRAVIDRYKDKKLVTDTSWAPTDEVSYFRSDCLSEKGITDPFETWFFDAGGDPMMFLMKMYNHAFVGSFVISDRFIKDRKGDHVINWPMHGGWEHNGHAIMYEMIYERLVVANSFFSRPGENHFAVHPSKIDPRFSLRRPNGQRRVREQCALHVYRH